jgi:prevent-host-death family protein
MVNFITVRELRPELSSVIKNIHEKFDRYFVTRHGKPEIVMMSVEDYESIMETLEIESDKELMKRLKKAKVDAKKGKGVSLDDLKRELKIV